ncbi:MAG: cell wall anchor protein, partial [Planctomycetota bacterium]|nr:cell wall anchor protein [Planctomycetota bacterium]
MNRTAERCVRVVMVAALAVCLGACPGGGGRGGSLPTGGPVRAWGWNIYGQLGDGTTSFSSPTSVQVVDPSDPTGL